MTKYAVVAACLISLSGCTIGGIIDQIEEECEAVASAYADEVETFCREAAIDAQNQCIAEINDALDDIYMSIEAEVTGWLLANGCVSIGTDQWDCSGSWVCGL